MNSLVLWSKIKLLLLLVVLNLCKFNLNAQDTVKTNPLTFSGYAELYFCYDLGNPKNHEGPSFFYNFKRHNEVNLNLGLLKANYNSNTVRGNFALMSGTYGQYNLATEPSIFQQLYEANIGFKLLKKTNLWVDAGITPSHIGFEGAIGKDCWNLTRSIVADNTPYYESGIKLGYTSNDEKLYLAAMYLNGWQRIQRIPGNSTPAFGTQLTYKSGPALTLNWSTYAGNEKPDSLSAWRYYNNFYGQIQLTNKISVTAGFDIGLQQMKKDSGAYSNCYSPILILQYKPSKNIRVSVRGEFYSDKDGIIIFTGTTNGFQTGAYSINVDFIIRDNVLWRIEGRSLKSSDKIFKMNGTPSSQNHFITTSLAITF